MPFKYSKIFGKDSSNKKRDLDGLNGYYDTVAQYLENLIDTDVLILYGFHMAICQHNYVNLNSYLQKLTFAKELTCSNMKENSLPAIASKKT